MNSETHRDVESTIRQLKASLGRRLTARRHLLGMSQAHVARRLGTGQSRLAKLEAGDPTVSLDLLVRSLLKLGVKPEEIGRVIVKRTPLLRKLAPLGL